MIDKFEVLWFSTLISQILTISVNLQYFPHIFPQPYIVYCNHSNILDAMGLYIFMSYQVIWSTTNMTRVKYQACIWLFMQINKLDI